jgi:hypothetical protein
MPTRSTAAGRPQIPTIACVNCAETPLGVGFGRLVRALQKFVDDHLAPVWGTPAKLVMARKPPRGAWVLVFLESADKKHAKDFGYHQFFKGQPIARVFVGTITISGKEPLSLVASHELAEMLVNPGCNLWARGPGNRLYSYEICDAVEEEIFEIDRLAMSDFVYPAYFEAQHKPKSAQFDHLKRITRPFQLLNKGYARVRKGEKPKTIFGSKPKERHFATEDRHLHRTESMG